MPQAQPTRADVSRANAQHSTGPRMAEGKTNSSRNSFKHGLYSKQLVYSDENAADLDALKADLRAEHQPASHTEEILVNEMAEQFWRIRRARRFEALVLENDPVILAQLAAIQRMMTAAERGFHKALTTLRQLQKERGFVPQFGEEQAASSLPQSQASVPQSGFVPQSGASSDFVEAGVCAHERENIAHAGTHTSYAASAATFGVADGTAA